MRLSKVNVHYGTFLSHPTTMPLSKPSGKRRFVEVVKTEEAGNDVSKRIGVARNHELHAEMPPTTSGIDHCASSPECYPCPRSGPMRRLFRHGFLRAAAVIVAGMGTISCGGSTGGTGECTLAPVAVATGLTSAYGIAVDESNIYWTDNDDYTITKMPKSGGTPTVLANGDNPRFIVLDGGYVYWNNSGGIVRVAKTGGAVEEVVSQSGAGAFALDPSTVYFTLSVNGGPVMSAPRTGGSATVLVDAQPNPEGIAVYGGTVYWANLGPEYKQGSVMQVPASGGTPSLIAANQGGPMVVLVDGSGVYWGNYQDPDQGLTKVPLSGGTPAHLAPDAIEQGLAMDDARVYFANDSGEIKSVSKNGGATCTLASGQPQPYELAVDDDYVYWTNYGIPMGSASVWKASKTCCE